MYYNPYLVIPFVAWLIAQTLKFVIAAFKGNLDFKYFYASGGMPSVHSAVVCSLATTALLLAGPQSEWFGITAILAAIVMYDSFGVRRASGEHAAALNMVIASLVSNRVKLDQPTLHLREVLGHRPLEVVMGALLGIFLSLLFNYQKIQAQIDFMLRIPVNLEFAVYLALFGVILLFGVIIKVIGSMKRFAKSPSLRALVHDIFIWSETIGWIGLILSFSQYERVAILGWRGWAVLLIAVAVVWLVIIAGRHWRTLPQAMKTENEKHRRQKWLPRKKR